MLFPFIFLTFAVKSEKAPHQLFLLPPKERGNSFLISFMRVSY